MRWEVAGSEEAGGLGEVYSVIYLVLYLLPEVLAVSRQVGDHGVC